MKEKLIKKITQSKISNTASSRFTCDGIITVEASIIIPIIFLLIAYVIIFSFYLHDKIAINSGAYRALIYAVNDVKNDTSSNLTDTYTIHNNINTLSFMYHPLKPELAIEENQLSITINFQGYPTRHIFSNFTHCDDIRKYSIIFKTIKETI